MRFVRIAAIAALPLLAIFTPNAHASGSCWHQNEAKAAQLRDLQIKLMVSTLQCRTKNSSAVELYNAFITKQRGLLDAHAQILKTHFIRENGANGGQAAYDRYATALANENSADADDPNYCSTMDTLVRMATAASQPDLLVLAQTMSEAPVSGACSPSYYALAEGKVVEQSAATPQPAVTAAAAQPAVETTSAAPAPAAQPDAMQAAIVALQSATAALQAASASAATAESSTAAKQAQAVVVKVEDAPVVPPQEVADE